MSGNPFPQPMLGIGADMDLTSGFPSEMARSQRKEREERDTQERERRIWRMLHDLKGPGSEVAQRLLARAVERIHALAVSDAELKLIFDTLGDAVFAEIRQGEYLAREATLDVCASLLRVSSVSSSGDGERKP